MSICNQLLVFGTDAFVYDDKEKRKMKKIKLVMIILVAAVLFAVVTVQGESDKQVQPAKIKPKAVTEIKAVPADIPHTSPFTGSKQGYQLVTDVLDGFGGESESDNYRIPVNSGGQPSAIGISESDNKVVEAGYVHASFVMRGDPNADRLINIADVVYVVNYLFISGLDPCPMEAGDATCDGSVNIADAVYLVNYLFIGGDPPGC
jgi:hypothetical protein